MYDNVTSEAELKRWLPPVGNDARVLVTTTQAYWPRDYAQCPVALLTPAEAQVFIRTIAGERVAKE